MKRAILALCLGFAATAASGCRVTTFTGAQCTLNSDCASPLVCGGLYCRAQCATNADCSGGAQCVASTQASVSVCLAPSDPPVCNYDSECPAPLFCTRTGHCGAQCLTARDCTAFGATATCASGLCVRGGSDDAGVPEAGAPDAGPLRLLGDPNLETRIDTHAVGLADASNYVANGSGTVVSLTGFYSQGDVTSLLLAIYDDVGGHPHTLLAQGPVGAPVVGAWNTATIAPVTITAGATYWIAMLAPVGSGMTFAFPYGVSTMNAVSTEHSAESNLTTFPTTWTSGMTFPGTFCSYNAMP